MRCFENGLHVSCEVNQLQKKKEILWCNKDVEFEQFFFMK